MLPVKAFVYRDWELSSLIGMARIWTSRRDGNLDLAFVTAVEHAVQCLAL